MRTAPSKKTLTAMHELLAEKHTFKNSVGKHEGDLHGISRSNELGEALTETPGWLKHEEGELERMDQVFDGIQNAFSRVGNGDSDDEVTPSR